MAQDLRGQRLAENPFVLGATLALLVNFVCIASFGSKVFFWDEWDQFVGFLNDLGRGKPLLSALWAPHNEHRIVLNRLISYFISSDPRFFMVLSSVVWWLAAIEFNRALKLNSAVRGWLGALVVGLCGFFMFLQIQAENFFWGAELVWFTSGLGVIGTLTSAAEGRWLRALVFFSIAYLTMASWVGLVPAVTAVLLFQWFTCKEGKREKARRLVRLASFCILMVFALFVYKDGISVPHHDHLKADVFERPHYFLVYVVSLLGLPFSFMGFYVGLVFGLLFLGSVAWIFWRKLEEFRILEASIFLYVLVMALVIAKSRSGLWRWGDRMPLRYATLMIPAWIAFFGLLLRVLGQRVRAIATLALIMAISIIDAASKGISNERGANISRDQAGICLLRTLESASERIEPASEENQCLKSLFPDPNVLIEKAREWRAQGRRL